jgi:hypothetical protein
MHLFLKFGELQAKPEGGAASWQNKVFGLRISMAVRAWTKGRMEVLARKYDS